MIKKSKPPQLVRINFESAKFKGASGKTYYIMESLSVDYYIQYQQLVPQVTFGVGFKDLWDTLEGIYKDLTTGNELMAAIRAAGDKAYNQMSAIKQFKIDSKEPAILKMAALWCCAEDEDLSRYDPKDVSKKIEDWKTAGIAMEDFFLLSIVKIKYFREIYLEFQGQADLISAEVK